MSMPIISIIVPIYNSEKHIENCVNSIIEQTVKEIEIILVNDGSTDNSGKICAELAAKNSRIKLINQENRGVSVARNTGKAMATGDYVIFIDSDDEMLPNMLEVLLKNIQDNEADISVCDIHKCRNKNDIIQSCTPEKVELLTWEEAIECLLLEKKLYYGCWNKLYRRDLIAEIEFVPGKRMNEDKYFVFRAIQNSNKVVYSNKKLYCYFIHENSAAHMQFSDRWFDVIYFSKKIYEDICNEFPELERQARYSMVKTMYFLIKKMNEQNVVKLYKIEYKKLIKDIRNIKITDIFSMFQTTTKIGLIIVRISPRVFGAITKTM